MKNYLFVLFLCSLISCNRNNNSTSENKDSIVTEKKVKLVSLIAESELLKRNKIRESLIKNIVRNIVIE